jgi:hypothetical protein
VLARIGANLFDIQDERVLRLTRLGFCSRRFRHLIAPGKVVWFDIGRRLAAHRDVCGVNLSRRSSAPEHAACPVCNARDIAP